MALTPEQLARHNQRRRGYRADPKYREQERERDNRRRKERRADPEYRRREGEYNNKLHRDRRVRDPAWRDHRNQCDRERSSRRYAELSERDRERMNRMHREWNQIRRARKKGVLNIPFTAAQWAAKVDYWGDRCWMCGGAWSACDHVKPIVAGGPHILANLRPVCRSCNSSKNRCWPWANILGVHARSWAAA